MALLLAGSISNVELSSVKRWVLLVYMHLEFLLKLHERILDSDQDFRRRTSFLAEAIAGWMSKRKSDGHVQYVAPMQTRFRPPSSTGKRRIRGSMAGGSRESWTPDNTANHCTATRSMGRVGQGIW